MPTLTPDDWRDPNAWTNGEVLLVVAFNVGWIVLVLVVYVLETKF